MKIYFQEKRRVLFFVRPSRGKGRVRRSQSRRGHLPVEREGINNEVNPEGGTTLPYFAKVYFQKKLVSLLRC